jgi:tetratricopeptide (TPR) repeat protein
MRTVIIFAAAAALSLTACKKAGSKKKVQPAAAKATDMAADKKKPAETAMVPVTSKSKEAVAEFQKGLEMDDNARGMEAVPFYKKALELDPDFAQAMASLGNSTPGAEGAAMLDKAVTLSAALPEAEKTVIQAMQLQSTGDDAAATAAWKKASELAPGDWRLHALLGNQANQRMDFDGALAHFQESQKVKPDLAVVHNGLAYAYAGQGKFDEAIAAAQKQVELLPKEPNPQDTLGEIFLKAGKFDESEKAFQAALAIEPKFGIAWQGVALARGYRGDWKGVDQALAEGGKATPPNGQITADMALDTAWMRLAAGKGPEGLKLVEKAEKDPEVQKAPGYAFAALDRGHMLTELGKYGEAAKAFAVGQERAQKLPGRGKRDAAGNHAIGMLRLAALTGKPAADADALIAVIETNAKEMPDNATRQSFAAWARGLAAWAKGDAKAAATEMAACVPAMVPCRYDLATAQRKAGDTAGADATLKTIGETSTRDPATLYFRVKAAKK